MLTTLHDFMKLQLTKYSLLIVVIISLQNTWAKEIVSRDATLYSTALKAYEKGDVVTALMIWLPLAESGDQQSQYTLGNLYLQKQDIENAIYWYQLAANQGYLQAQTRLGLLYFDGKHVEKNSQLAASYFLMASRNRQAMAKSTDQIQLEDTENRKRESLDYDKGMQAYRHKDYATALMHWLPLTNPGNPDALYMIGKLYLQQENPANNPLKAEYWLIRAAEQGHLEAQSDLGFMYFNGTQIEQDYRQAAKWLLLASQNEQAVKVVKKSAKAEKKKKISAFNKGMIAYQKKDYVTALMLWYPLGLNGHADAQFMLGNLYMREQDIYKDPVKGLAWYEQAISQNDIQTTKSLGLMYLYGNDVKENTDKAIALLLKAARQGDAESQFTLANIYLKGKVVKSNPPKAAYWYQEAANKKHADAQYALAEMYRLGTGIKQNSKKAISLYKKANKLGHHKAALELGKHYYHGRKKPDYAKALTLFSKAAQQGEPAAQYYLGEMYFHGKGVSRDLNQAFNWYLQAAKQAYTEAEYSVGKMYVNGYGTKRDFKKGVGYFLLAAKKGHAHAQNEVAVAYYTNQGVDRDPITAYAWFYLASRKGVKGADSNRIKVYKSLSVKDKKRANALVADFWKAYK